MLDWYSSLRWQAFPIDLDEALQAQRCFATDSLVMLADGRQKIIADLHSGDRILAFDDTTKQIITTDVLTMLDYQPTQFGKYSSRMTFFDHFHSTCSNVQTINNDVWSTIISHLDSSSSN